MENDFEEMQQESNLFPWLDSDCMSDLLTEDAPFNFNEYLDSNEDY